jgi:predicted Zn-ribbon and HTH transcriptional regulator
MTGGAPQTRRQRIAALLRAGPIAVPEIARLTGASVKGVLADLEHVRRGLDPGEAWAVSPAECSSCGFAFKGRERLDVPSRCPECRSEDIAEARYAITARGG